MQFSKIIIGTMRWGIWGATHPEKEVRKLIDASLAENLSTFDHADIYGDYTAEKLFGNAFSGMNINREDVQFISKCGIEMPCSKKNYKVKSYNYSKEHILNSVDQSLKTLRTEYLDLLLLHRPSPLMNPAEIAEAFEILRARKKVRHFGVSNFSPSQFDLLNDEFPLTTNQVEISLNKTNAFYDGTLDQLMRRNLRPMAWSVLGNYFSASSKENLRIKKILEKLCLKYEAQENQLLLAFLLKHPAQILPVIGTSRAEKITELSAALDIPLEREDWFLLLEAKEGKEVD